MFMFMTDYSMNKMKLSDQILNRLYRLNSLAFRLLKQLFNSNVKLSISYWAEIN